MGQLCQFGKIDVQFYSGCQTSLLNLSDLPSHVVDLCVGETLIDGQLLGQVDETFSEHLFEFFLSHFGVFDHVLAPVFVNGAHQVPHIEVVHHL